MSQSKIKVEAMVSAVCPKVWEFWTEPEHIVNWNFASDDWRCPKAINDLRVGGRYKARMEAKDGSVGFDFEAVYDEVIDQKRLTYTLSDERKVTTEFENVGGQTRVTTVFDAEKENPEEMQKNGWQAILNNFKTYVEEY